MATWFRRRPSWAFFWLASWLIAAGCRPGATTAPFDPADPGATAKRLRAQVRKNPKDTEAWRKLAHVQWMHLGQTDQAIPILDRLARGGDPMARISRLLIAADRADHKTARTWAFALVKAAAKAKPAEPRGALTLASAQYAARHIDRMHGSLPDDDEAFLALFDGLPLRALPFEVRQPLLSERAAIARRQGQPYKRWYAEQGCAQDWAVGPLVGTHGDLELEGIDPDGFRPDPEATLVPLACVVRTWNPSQRAATRTLQTHLAVPGSTLLLDISAQEAVRVYLDGRLLMRTDVTHVFPSTRTRLQVEVEPGLHQLSVVTAIPGDRAWVLVRATDGSGRPVGSQAKSGANAARWGGRFRVRRSAAPQRLDALEDRVYAPLAQYLAAAEALADGNSNRAERIAVRLAEHARFASGQSLVARFERLDPSRGETVSSAREQQALRRAVELDPALDAARLRLYEIMLRRNEETELDAQLKQIDKSRLRGVRGELLRFRTHLAQGRDHLAEQALARAAKLHPTSCRVLMSKRTMAQRRDDVGAEDKLAAALVACAGSHKLRARLAEKRGRLQQSEALWAQVVERTPDEIEALESLARLAARRGDEAQARRHLERVLRLNPFRVGALVAMADLDASAGKTDAARKSLRKAIDRVPYSAIVRRAGEAVGVPDDLDALRIDGRAALTDYRASGVTYEGVSEVLVLDRSGVRIYADGGQRQIVHLVVHLLSKEALDRYGEISIPDGARLLTLRSIKPDDSIVEPELIPGKDGLSLRHLEVGDVVEYEFVTQSSPNEVVPGYIDVSTFRFQSLDIPYHRSELEVVHPKGLALRQDRRNDPPEMKVAERPGGLVSRLWRADRVPRLGVEPSARPLLDELPAVRVYTALDLQAWIRGLALTVRKAGRTNPALRDKARALVKGKATPRERLDALWSWVVENIEEGGDLSTSATATLSARGGSRLMLLRSMLREVGIHAELWLARDAFGPSQVDGGHPMIEQYDAPMLAVDLPGRKRPLMVMTALKVMPVGYLTPGLSGTEAVRVPLSPGDGPPKVVKLPKSEPQLADRRKYDVTLDLDRSGSGTVRGTIELQGMEAVQWRQALRDVDRDRIEEMFQSAELGWLRGATLSKLEIRNEAKLTRPLILDFTAQATEIGVRQDGTLLMRSALMPMNPGARYTTLPRRRTGLLVQYAPEQQARVVLRLSGAKFTEIPANQNIETPFGRFERSVKDGGVGKSILELRVRSVLRAGVVEPGAYPQLAEFSREIQAAEQFLIQAK